MDVRFRGGVATVSRVSSVTVCVAMFDNTGATFTSLTMTVKVLVAFKCGVTKSYGLLLVTMVVMVFVPGLWSWLGVQVTMLLVLMFMPVGAPTSR